MSNSPRLGLPFLDPGQAQKEFTHNEALQRLDTLVAAAVAGPAQNAPPASPAVGDCFLVGVTPSGAWSGQANAIAAFSAGGWRFIAPFEGLELLVKSTGLKACFRGGAWELGVTRTGAVSIGGDQVLGARQGAIADVTGGATADSEARAAIAAILGALRAHGLIAP